MHTVKFVANRKYFSEMFSQSIRHTNKWRKFERILGPVFLIVGVYLTIKTGGKFMSPIVLIGFGTYEVLSPVIKKPIWMQRQMKSRLANCELELNFDESGFKSHAPHSDSFMTWEGVERIEETPKGIFIWPQKEVHMYVPKSVANIQVIEFIKTKA